jgi:hypothetical protein
MLSNDQHLHQKRYEGTDQVRDLIYGQNLFFSFINLR